MTARRIRDLRRILEAEAEPYGASVTIELTNGSHLRHIFRLGDRHVFVISALSPHNSWRTHRQVRAEARRVLRQLASRTQAEKEQRHGI
jgi:hypothetical protein